MDSKFIEHRRSFKHLLLRKGSYFEQYSKDIRTIAEKLYGFPELESVFGQEWVQNEINTGFFPIVKNRIAPLEWAIKNMKILEGFEEWKSNITQNPRGFDSYEFELVQIDRMAKISDKLELYPIFIEKDNPIISEIKVCKNSIEFYVEMTKFYEMKNPYNKIKKMIEKGRRQIPKNSCGFMFVDVGDVVQTEILRVFSPIKVKYDLDSKLDNLMDVTDEFFKGDNTRILGILYVMPYLGVREDNFIELVTEYGLCINEHNKLKLEGNEIKDLIF